MACGKILLLGRSYRVTSAGDSDVLAFKRIHSSFFIPKLACCAVELSERRPIVTPKVAAKKLSKFNPKTFLSTMDGGRKIAAFAKKQVIFVQGDSSDAVFYIQKGKVRLTVVSKIGK
jgi:hypothetical protein